MSGIDLARLPNWPELDSLDPVNVRVTDHQGDARAAVATFVADCRQLREQLALTECVMSRGLPRGWLPTYARN